MDEAAVRDWLDLRAADHLFSGVAMVWLAGEPAFVHGAGLAHRGLGVPMWVDARFHVASITKMITATAAMRLVERGQVALDQPLIEVLPAELRPRSMGETHTLHHLLSHTSGFTNYHDDDDETFASFTSAWDRIAPHRLRGPADLLPLFADLPLMFEPGDGFQYGDVNYVLTGILIEAITGRSYSDVMMSEVLAPAGMISSSFTDMDLEPAGKATGYMVTDDPPETWRSNVYSVPAGGMPDGGLISTATDLCRFIDAFNQGQLVSDATRSAMLTSYGKINDDAEDYGYGMEMLIQDGRPRVFGHAGGDPGVSGMVSHFIAEATTIVVLCNHDRGSWPVSKWLADAVGIADPRE